MKIYSKIVWDKDDNIIEEESYEYTGPLAHCGGGSPPPPAPPPPPPTEFIPPDKDTAMVATRTTGRALEKTARGRGVLIRPTAPLGVDITSEEQIGGTRKNLLQPTQSVAQGILGLLRGGY